MMQGERNIGFEIKSLSNYMKRRIHQSSIIRLDRSLTSTQGMILGYIDTSAGDVFQRDIEHEFSMRRSTVSGILDVMEKNNLIVRERVSFDARLRRIVMTPKARELLSQILLELTRIDHEMRSGIDDSEIAAFLATAEKIKRNLMQ